MEAVQEHLQKKILNSIRIFFLIFLFSSCLSNNQHVKWFQDYDLYGRKGINELKGLTDNTVNRKRALKLTFDKSELKKIDVLNLLDSNPRISLILTQNDSISVYQTKMRFDSDVPSVAYFCFTKSKATTYVFLSDELINDPGTCYVTVTTRDTSFGGLRVIDQKDTANLLGKLLSGKQLSPQRHLFTFNFKNRIGANFTLLRWMHLDTMKQNTPFLLK